MWGSGDNSGPSNNSSIASAGGIVSQATANRRQYANNTSNRSSKRIYRLLAFVVFCALVYYAWGPLLIVTCALAVILHLCYSLYVNDSFVTPYSSLLLGHAVSLAIELVQTLRALFAEGLEKSRVLLQHLKRQYKDRFNRQLETAAEDDSMSDGKRNLYRHNLPINKNPSSNLNRRDSELFNSFTLNGLSNVIKTSTPLLKGSNFKRTEKQNGVVNMFTPSNSILSKKVSPMRSENKPSLNLSQTEDILYSSKNSSWNHSVSPKIKDKSDSLKTVQNVAGPLLNSSRYNMDPKLYTDISSPGLASRLTKYASEANNKLTHQPQYGTGQFPKVNLNASPKPVLSPKVIKSRMPVTVRVAPPEITNYSPADASSQQDKSKIYSSNEIRESKSCPNVVQVLKKMALKRHASRDEIMMDFKKQKADQEYEGQLENLEEMMQKRTRDESTMSDDEMSTPSSSQRPAKRSKSSSCHDVINSLSSSAIVFTGVKRKATDSLCSNAPDNEKIFKPSNTSLSPDRSSSLTSLPSKEIVRSKEQLNVKVPIKNTPGESHENKNKQRTPEVQQTNEITPERKQSSMSDTVTLSTPKIIRQISHPSISKPEKLTDKLFMKPEPQANEKLKSLIKEQGKVDTPFRTDDKDEIKKQDIDNMRQNSMRMRLKSMFDAISGKSASKINPDVVIQAEEVNSPPETSSSYASLNSLTSTTTVNTSPITTTIVPILKSDDNKSQQTAPKHVTFNLPSSSSLSSSSSSGLSTLSNSEAPKSTESKTFESKSSEGFSTTTTSAPSFSFGNKPATSAAVTSSSASSGGFSFSTNSTATTTPSVNTSVNKSPSSVSTPFSSKSTTEAMTTSSFSSSSTPTTSGYSFGTTVTAQTTTPASSTFSFTPSAMSPSFSNTSPTSSAPSFSFSSSTSASTAPTFSFNSNNSLTSVRSTESNPVTNAPVLGFGNSLTKSPSNTSFAPTSTPSIGNTSNKPSLFGAQSSNSPFSMSNNTTTSSTAPVTTSITSTPSMFNFNANSKPASSGFSFNAPTTTTASIPSTNTTTSTFSFGSNTQSNASSASGTSPFAMPATSSTTSTAPASTFNSTPSIFNTPSNSQSLFSGASTMGSSPMFKGPTTTTAATTSTPSIFGSTSSGFAPATTTAAPSLFGNNTPASTIPSLFGNTASTTISTAPSSSFGASVTQQSGIFSGTTATTSSSIFGASSPSSSLFSGSNSTSTNPASAADNTSIFGQSKPTTFGGTTSPFGATSQSSGFASMNNPSSNSTAFQIGSTPSTSSLPAFGKPTTTFGAPASTSSGSIFGSTTGGSTFGSVNTSNPPAFGSTTQSGTFGTTSSGSTFGSATPGVTFGSGPSASSSTFGSGTSAPSSAFGSSTSPVGNTFGSGTSAPGSAFGSGTAAPSSTFGSGTSTFGSSSSTFGNPIGTTSPFGGAPTSTQSPSLFGNTSATNSTSGGTFSFGGAQSSQQQPQQQSSPFNFGSANNANTSGSGGMFQFGGANTAPKPAGFNFNAPTGAPAINFSGSAPPPAFNAPAPNMFSIGSGSSTPRSRSSRQRRQR